MNIKPLSAEARELIEDCTDIRLRRDGVIVATEKATGLPLVFGRRTIVEILNHVASLPPMYMIIVNGKSRYFTYYEDAYDYAEKHEGIIVHLNTGGIVRQEGE